MTLKRQEKNGNIFFLKQYTLFYKKMYVWHFYPKIPTGLHSGLHYMLDSVFVHDQLKSSVPTLKEAHLSEYAHNRPQLSR